MSDFNLDSIHRMYYIEQKSINQIAKENNTYPKKIIRYMKKHGMTIRDKSESQKLALLHNRHKHPTKGTNRSQNVREKISTTQFNNWMSLSEEAKQQHRQKIKEQWSNKTEKQKQLVINNLLKQGEKTKCKNSKVSKAIFDILLSHKFDVKNHSYLENITIDFVLPIEGIAINVNGPGHYLDIWREENLKKDEYKKKKIIDNGYKLILVKYFYNDISMGKLNFICKTLIDTIYNIEKTYTELLFD